MKLKITIEIEGQDDGDLELAREEAMRWIRKDFTSGHNSNDTGSYKFEVENLTKEPAQLESAEFIAVTALIPNSWGDWFWDVMSVNAPFVWGANNRTLVTASRLLEHVERILEAERNSGVLDDGETESEDLLLRLRALGETYVDLEN